MPPAIVDSDAGGSEGLEEVESEFGLSIGLREDCEAGLLEDLEASEFSHIGSEISIDDLRASGGEVLDEAEVILFSVAESIHRSAEISATAVESFESSVDEVESIFST